MEAKTKGQTYRLPGTCAQKDLCPPSSLTEQTRCVADAQLPTAARSRRGLQRHRETGACASAAQALASFQRARQHSDLFELSPKCSGCFGCCSSSRRPGSDGVAAG